MHFIKCDLFCEHKLKVHKCLSSDHNCKLLLSAQSYGQLPLSPYQTQKVDNVFTTTAPESSSDPKLIFISFNLSKQV